MKFYIHCCSELLPIFEWLVGTCTLCVCVCLCELCPILAKLCCSILRLSDTRFQGLAFVPSIPLCQVNYLLIHMEPDWDHFYQVANNTDSREEKKVA